VLADENVDAVYLPLPNSLHFEWVEKAAQAKKHILCEKPMALNAGQAEQMYEICEAEGVLLMEAFAYRHAPFYNVSVYRYIKQNTGQEDTEKEDCRG